MPSCCFDNIFYHYYKSPHRCWFRNPGLETLYRSCLPNQYQFRAPLPIRVVPVQPTPIILKKKDCIDARINYNMDAVELDDVDPRRWGRRWLDPASPDLKEAGSSGSWPTGSQIWRGAARRRWSGGGAAQLGQAPPGRGGGGRVAAKEEWRQMERKKPRGGICLYQCG